MKEILDTYIDIMKLYRKLEADAEAYGYEKTQANDNEGAITVSAGSSEVEGIICDHRKDRVRSVLSETKLQFSRANYELAHSVNRLRLALTNADDDV